MESWALLGARRFSPGRWHASWPSHSQVGRERSPAQKPMPACASALRPGVAVVAPARLGNRANGQAVPAASRSLREGEARILSSSGLRLCVFRAGSPRRPRRAGLHRLEPHLVDVQVQHDLPASRVLVPVPLSRAPSRLDFPERLARNRRTPTASKVTIRRVGVPERFPASLGKAPASPGFACRPKPSSRTSTLLPGETRAPLALAVPPSSLLRGLFCSSSRRFCHLFWALGPVRSEFPSAEEDELFNTLVAHFVGRSSTSPATKRICSSGMFGRRSG